MSKEIQTILVFLLYSFFFSRSGSCAGVLECLFSRVADEHPTDSRMCEVSCCGTSCAVAKPGWMFTDWHPDIITVACSHRNRQLNIQDRGHQLGWRSTSTVSNVKGWSNPHCSRESSEVAHFTVMAYHKEQGGTFKWHLMMSSGPCETMERIPPCTWETVAKRSLSKIHHHKWWLELKNNRQYE